MVAQRVALFVFEKGDMHQGDLYHLLKRRKIDTVVEAQLVSKSWKEPGGSIPRVRPFEACDMWA